MLVFLHELERFSAGKCKHQFHLPAFYFFPESLFKEYLYVFFVVNY